MFTQDLLRNMDQGVQTDVVVMDFSKAFDKVPHRRLKIKLDYYGIRGHTLEWISNFLSGRRQQVLLDGAESEEVDVVSGVPQGTVLGPILFLLFINDLPDNLTSSARLFADDCVVYRPINSAQDASILQQDIDRLTEWEQTWQMEFNPSKCHVLHVTRGRTPRTDTYHLRGHALECVTEAKYLGVTLTHKLDWATHIRNICGEANRSLAFVRRNLRTAPNTLKEAAYKSLVRPKLEYSSSVWSPHTQGNVAQIEKVQRRAARFVSGRFRNTSSVGDMLHNLKWESLERRRLNARVTMAFKIREGSIAIPVAPFLVDSEQRSSRQVGTNTVPVLYARTNYLKYSFFYRAPVLWNCLPPSVRSAPSLDSFKSRLAGVADLPLSF